MKEEARQILAANWRLNAPHRAAHRLLPPPPRPARIATGHALRRHAKSNLCELGSLTQRSAMPQAAWLNHIFLPVADGGLGLTCPVVMVKGNHEGFDVVRQRPDF